MTTQVVPTDEVLGRFARQQHDWFERVRKGSLDPKVVARAVHALIDWPFKFDRRPYGWELLEDTEEPWPIEAGNLELIPFLRDGENYIDSEKAFKRARGELGVNFGQRHAEYLLEHQGEIPECQDLLAVLVFTGTLWQTYDGQRMLPCFRRSGRQWCLCFARELSSRSRLLRPCE